MIYSLGKTILDILFTIKYKGIEEKYLLEEYTNRIIDKRFGSIILSIL
jgi:hypothetical protein